MGKDYPESSCTSMIVGAIENGILRVMVELAKARKMKIEVLAYDGMMVNHIPEGFLEEVEQAIEERTGYAVKLTEKEIPEYDLEALRARYVKSEPAEEVKVTGKRKRKREPIPPKGDSLKNVSGDDKDSVMYRYDSSTCLWLIADTADIMVFDIAGSVRPEVRAILDAHATRIEHLAKQSASDEAPPLSKQEQAELYLFGRAEKVWQELSKASKLWAVMRLLCNTVRDQDFKKKLNADPEALSVRNGVINLRTKELRARTKEDHMTYAIDFDYDPEHPEKPELVDIMKQITLANILGRTDYLVYLQQLLGYGLTAYDREEIVAFLIGNGANGKGLINHFMKLILGPLFYSAAADLVRASKHGRGPGSACSDVMKMKGKRVVYIDEMPEGRIDEQLFTSLSGGADIAARELHGKQEEFPPTHLLIINSNHMPVVNPSPMIIRRIAALPFDAEFRLEDDGDIEMRYDPENPCQFKRDNSLKTRISNGYLCGAFLSWAVDGASTYLEAGKLPPKPECCAVKCDDIKIENDRLGQFLEETLTVTMRCIEAESEEYSCASLLLKYNAFRRPRAIIKKRDMQAEMEKRGFPYEKSVRGTRVWVYKGIRYNTEEYHDF
ncbi:hypothetical protein JKP88DRAFT_282681 [Tribonema minus]|uniref:SF3 helicase domain-containing protein n=1 Tax=Tribonema minus TaxID=303371 RepID=A0A836C9C3_9STRA|nr:hypothetical protein JKP88DRAFT_282681 [Tribonema minus]